MYRELQIDEEFKNIIPPQSDDEHKRLEREILKDGVKEPIEVWNGVIVDGHNRYSICQKHALPCQAKELKFDSREDAKLYIIRKQLARRNLPVAAIGDLKLEEKEIVAKQAKARQGKRTDITPNLGESSKANKHDGETFTKLAKDIPLGRESLRKLDRIKREAKEGNPVAISEREKLLSGEKKSIHGAYIEVVGKPKPRKPSETVTEDGRKICHMCGEPINPEDAHAVRPNVHRLCEQEYQHDWKGKKASEKNASQYYNPEISLLKNVAIYNRDSLIAELNGSAEMLETSWTQSLEINEGQGVRLTEAEKKRLLDAINGLYAAIKNIKREG